MLNYLEDNYTSNTWTQNRLMDQHKANKCKWRSFLETKKCKWRNSLESKKKKTEERKHSVAAGNSHGIYSSGRDLKTSAEMLL